MAATIPLGASAQPAATAGAASGADAAARALARRVASVADGTVRFRYAARPDVCGDGAQGITFTDVRGTRRSGGVSRGDGGWATDACEPGPARVTVRVRGGVPGEVRLGVGGRAADDDRAGVVDLGPVAAPAAAAYLLDVASRPDAPSPGQAVLAAVVADSAVVWPPLLRLARDERLPRNVRRDAAFWVSHFACDATAAARPASARADTADRDVRTQVVFALSQRPDAERGATLTRVARDDRDPAVRCAALFWLAQGGRGAGADAGTLRLLEDVLRHP